MTKAVMTERELILHIQAFAAQENQGVDVGLGSGLVQGIGDDCAVVTKDQKDVWLLTMDTLVESESPCVDENVLHRKKHVPRRMIQ
ncbi:MAG: hypothetical protein D3913_02345 [Candidatus Electrothrix sp. LOE1_4_5]|nr:hypothetical protein [Candidatus Electrothrix gigas]